MEMAVASLHPPKSWAESGTHFASIMDKKASSQQRQQEFSKKKTTKVAVEVREQYLNAKNNHLVYKISRS